VQNAICVKHLPGGVIALIGRVLKKIDQSGVQERLFGSADEYVNTLQAEFSQLASGCRPLARIISIPAVAEENDVLRRKPGEYLWTIRAATTTATRPRRSSSTTSFSN
jgi:hypothetical protein